MRKLGTKTYYKKKADALMSKIVRNRGKCEMGPYADNKCTEQLQNHHYIGRRNHTLRFDLMNCFCLCAGHHKLFNQSAHEDPQWFDKTVRERFPDRYIYIQRNKILITKRTALDYKELVEGLQKLYDEKAI